MIETCVDKLNASDHTDRGYNSLVSKIKKDVASIEKELERERSMEKKAATESVRKQKAMQVVTEEVMPERKQAHGVKVKEPFFLATPPSSPEASRTKPNPPSSATSSYHPSREGSPVSIANSEELQDQEIQRDVKTLNQKLNFLAEKADDLVVRGGKSTAHDFEMIRSRERREKRRMERDYEDGGM